LKEGGDAVSEMTFKEMMGRLEEITSTLEKEDLELEEGLRLFEEGVGLIREARQRLTAASSKVEKLIGSMEEGLVTEEFELEGAPPEDE
jgi:exodeoxyribonuclease VII small subunit